MTNPFREGIVSSATRLCCCALLVLGASSFELSAGEDAEDSQGDLSHYYGFEALEIFKLERRSQNMLARDMNGDGRTDLILFDNGHSRIDLLQQRQEKPDQVPRGSEENSINEVGSDWRFEHRKIPVDKEISAMAVGDFNGDGRTDIAYFGTPDRLVVRLQSESGGWTDSTGFRLPDVPSAPWSVAAGDLNADGHEDLVVLGEHATYLVYQQSDGRLASPETLMNTSDNLGLVQIADLDGDGRSDLCYLARDNPDRSFCARFQQSDGQLGPEIRFALNKPRGLSLFNIDGEPGDEVLAVDSRTGRVHAFKLHRPETQPGELAGRLIEYGFGRRGLRRNRDLATGDLDGDGLTDVVVTEPETAQMIVFRQHAEQGLDLGTPYPGLVGAEQVRMADFDGDGTAEVIVLSKEEQTIGLSRLEGSAGPSNLGEASAGRRKRVAAELSAGDSGDGRNKSIMTGRLSFPQSIPIENEPMAFEIADLDADGFPELIYLSRSPEAPRDQYDLRALRWSNEKGWQPVAFDKQEKVSVEIGGEPRRMIRLEANQDQRPDILVFPGLDRPPHLFVTNDRGIPVEVPTRAGIGLSDVSAGAVFIGRLDAPVLLMAERNFARNLRLDEDRQWQVLDQYNARESDAEIVGVATINLDAQPGNEIVLVDSGVGKLRVLRQEGSLFRPWQEVDIGDFPYKSTHVADLNGDERDDLLLFGLGKFAVLYAGQRTPVLKDVASFETELEDTYLADVVAGDLNGDARPDLAVIDTRSHYVEILHFDGTRSLEHAMHFKVFEEKSFQGRDGSGSQPREGLVADVTNDGLADLVLLTHDRVLVYPQDDGE